MIKKDFLENSMDNLALLEEMYQKYRLHSQDLDSSWRQFFQQMEKEEAKCVTLSVSQLQNKMDRIFCLAEAYRRHGHLLAAVNPLAMEELKIPEELKLENLGFQACEEEEMFPTLNLLPQVEASLKKILAGLRKHYTQSVGFEFKDFLPLKIERWIQDQIESGRFDDPLSPGEQLTILDMLIKTEALEAFLHTKYVGKKRFSLEGSEALVPMLATLVATAAEEGVKEFFIGMSHRGRLNVLANILNQPLSSIFSDFDDDIPTCVEGAGDVRYHKGYTNEAVKTDCGKSIKLTMAPNPSHLESINPVIEGQTHARQFLAGDEEERRQIIPLLMHGDAALAGQGIVYETLQMNKLYGFQTGGTLHIVINNQIGFTTPPSEGRSTLYCTDIAKAFAAPVFHLNAEDPEMCIRVGRFALEVRQRFHCDVFIDLNCYRKYGHNEGDEPVFTQPSEYQIIRDKVSVANLYFEHLLKQKSVKKEVLQHLKETFHQHLQKAYELFQEEKKNNQGLIRNSQSDIPHISMVETRVNISQLQQVANCFIRVPSGFHLNSKIKKIFSERYQAIFEDRPIDWGTAELLAYGTLLLEGTPVRLVGQDSGRGTFSHRHARWIDQKNRAVYSPLSNINQHQARFEALNTCLSEAAVVGFEYGYSTLCTKGLNIWEAQFGDFVNSAQVIVDQYIASGEQKWGQKSNLVLFLPHGFEGQGPEHSSARLERFLSLAGHENIQIVNPTTPAQFFHLLRRQVQQPQKPLVILTPKGLLRHPNCISKTIDLTKGGFYWVLDDPKRPKKNSQISSL